LTVKEDVCHEENISAEQQKAQENAWVQGPYENRRRTESPQEPKGQGQEKIVRLMDERLTPQERIRKKKEFLALYKTGSRYRGKHFHLVYRANSFEFPRLAVVVSKKVGNAVTRNKIKRRIRALFRRNKSLFKKPMDVVLIAKIEIQDLSVSDLSAAFFSALERIFREQPVR
jgi:ribonuclease P protein component